MYIYLFINKISLGELFILKFNIFKYTIFERKIYTYILQKLFSDYLVHLLVINMYRKKLNKC